MAFSGGEVVGIDYQPLGQVVIGGLISSTLLTLVVVPLLYTLFDDLSLAPREVLAWRSIIVRKLRTSTSQVTPNSSSPHLSSEMKESGPKS